MAILFKIGDHIKPIIGKKTSNQIKIEGIVELEVTLIRGTYAGKTEIGVKTLKGIARTTYGGTIMKQQQFTVFADAFELCTPEEQDYEIY